jgi:hypothetical protein
MTITRFRPYHRYEYPIPIIGKNGYKLLAYQWQYFLEDDGIDRNGNERVKRVSDWTQAELNNFTKRYIVHQFMIEDSAGKSYMASAETAMKLLGSEKKSFNRMIKAVHSLDEYKEIAETVISNKKIADSVFSPFTDWKNLHIKFNRKEFDYLHSTPLLKKVLEEEQLLDVYNSQKHYRLIYTVERSVSYSLSWCEAEYLACKLCTLGYKKVDEKIQKKIEKWLDQVKITGNIGERK